MDLRGFWTNKMRCLSKSTRIRSDRKDFWGGGGDQEKVELTPGTLSSCSNAFGGWWYLRLVKTNVSCLKFFLHPIPTGPHWVTASGVASVIFSIPPTSFLTCRIIDDESLQCLLSLPSLQQPGPLYTFTWTTASCVILLPRLWSLFCGPTSTLSPKYFALKYVLGACTCSFPSPMFSQSTRSPNCGVLR